MKLAHVLASILLLTLVSFAQQSNPSNPQDRTANPTDQTYTRPVETGHNWGGWGLLGLFGLAGLLGRRRETTTTGTGYTRDDRTYGQQQRRVG
jgi:MYXO-CTERM domain-containing protein